MYAGFRMPVLNNFWVWDPSNPLRTTISCRAAQSLPQTDGYVSENTPVSWSSNGHAPLNPNIKNKEQSCTSRWAQQFFQQHLNSPELTGTQTTGAHASNGGSASSWACQGRSHISRSSIGICRNRNPIYLLPNTNTADLCTTGVQVHLA